MFLPVWKMRSVFMLVVLVVIGYVSGDQLDKTRESNATGPEVVEAVIGVLRRSCIFEDMLVYLRRVALVDTLDGTTSIEPFQGGIWKISPADFNTTKFDPALQVYRDRILDTLFIQWNATTWEDLRKPLYSAIATQLYAVLATGGQGIPVSTEEQAALWSRGNSTANIFVRTVEILEINIGFDQEADIVFVIDSSASMSDDDFEKAKLFIQNAIRDLNIDKGKVRVAVVEFSTSVYPQFGLDNGMVTTELLQAVQNITYQAGGTKTDVALQYVRDHVLKEDGARPDAAQFIILITDGRSDDSMNTINIARSLRNTGVTIYAVAVGEFIDKQELAEVVSVPSCSYIQIVTNFTDLPAIGHNAVLLAKDGPVVLQPGVYSFSCGSDVTAEIIPALRDGLTIDIQTGDGDVAMYGGVSTAYIPSAALYAFNDTVTSSQITQIYVRDDTTLMVALRNMTSQGCASYVTITVREGNQIRVGTELLCVEAGLISSCELKEFEGSPFILTGTPPKELSEGSCRSSADSFLAPYPDHTDRYLMCTAGRMIVVYCEVSQKYDIAKSRCIEMTKSPSMSASSSVEQTTTSYHVTTAGNAETPTTSAELTSTAKATVELTTSRLITTITTSAKVQTTTTTADATQATSGTTKAPSVKTTPIVTTHAPTHEQTTFELTTAPPVQTTTAAPPKQPTTTVASKQTTEAATPEQTTVNPTTHKQTTAAATSHKQTTAAVTVQPTTTTKTAVPYVETTSSAQHVSFSPNTTGTSFLNPCTVENIRNGDFYFPYPGDESRYIHCSIFPGSGTVGTCDQHQYFSTTLKTCLNKDTIDVDSNQFLSNVTNPCLATGVDGALQFYSYPGDTHKFIHCDQYGESYVQECGQGLIWNDVIKACVQH